MSKKMTLLLTGVAFSAGTALAQKVVTGTVVDTDGEPVIGANVLIAGTRIGVQTDNDGKFTIKNVPASAKKITVSYIGMEPKTVNIAGNVNVVMKMSDSTLGEVVVTGMQKMDRRLFTGSTTKVDAEKVKLDGVADVSRALEGRVAGVSVQNISSTFGTAPKIRVRGATSIYGSSSPLWVVDGVIMEDAVNVSADDLSSGDAETLISNAIAGLNADDIESFQVLKDGSATSIYGARAMAGVVVITTKKGRSGHSQVNYTGELTYRLKPSYSEYNICNSQEQMSILKEMAAKGWMEYATLANSSSSGIYGSMYHLMSQYDESKGEFGLPYTQAAMNAYLQQAEFRNTNWFDLLFKNSVMQNHAISVSAGTDRANVYASLSLMNDPGWTLDSNVRRFTANVNASYNVLKNLTVTLRTNGSFRDQAAPGTMNRDVDVVSGNVNRNFDINPFSFCLNTSRTLDPNATYTRNYAPFNIFEELENNYIDVSLMDLKFQGDISWKPLQGWEINALGSYRVNSSSREHYVKNNSNQANAYRAGLGNPIIMAANRYLYTDPDKPNSDPICVMPEGGIYTINRNGVRQLDFRASTTYNRVWNDTHILSLFGAMEINSADYDASRNETYGVDYNKGRLVIITPEFYKQVKEDGTNLTTFSRSWNRRVAFAANANYSYKGRYTLNLTGRYDGSNQLGKKASSRWLPTYNISASWNAHEEKWFRDWMLATGSKFSHATMRFSYSLTGEQNLASNYNPIFYSNTIWRPQPDQQETGIYVAQDGNADLTYEKKHEYNLGIDLGFLDNRINFVSDFYIRENFDLIGYTNTQGFSGTINKLGNVASMASHGAEATLSTHNIRTKDWDWTSDFTLAWCETEITQLVSRSRVIDLVSSSGYALEGYPHRAIFSIPFMGLNDEGIPTILNEKGQVTTSDINFQEYENLSFLKYEGPVDPTFTGGLNNMVRWKNWRLNLFFTYNFGNKIRLERVFSAGYSDDGAMPRDFKNRWAVPGDEEKTNIPTIASRRQVKNDYLLGYAYSAYNYSTERVADGGFIRLKDVSLTYDVPKQALAKVGIGGVSFKLDATNLWLVYADKKLNGQDPEFINSGGVAQPLSKQFTFTVRLSL